MRTLTILSTILAVNVGLATARTWKEAGTERTIVGEFVRTEGDSVLIIRPNGTNVKVPLARLSDEDKKFVAQANPEKAAPAGDEQQANPEKAAPAGGELKWETDFEVAKKRAKDDRKPMLLYFAGSDWCGWCIRLRKEVFDTTEFAEYAKANLILVILDSPKRKELPENEKKQNAGLAEKYMVEGYPTIVLLSSRGREVARTGYQEGGPKKYVEHLKDLL